MPLLSMYLDMAWEEDKEMAERWKGDTKGIILFVSPNVTLYALHFISTYIL
jgi:hypothetical protein